MNRELVRLLAHVGDAAVADRLLAHLQADVPAEEKLHLAMHLPAFRAAWTTDQKLAILKFYEQARSNPGGVSLGRFIERATVEFGGQLNDDERLAVLRHGSEWPTAAMSALARMPEELPRETLTLIQDLDRRLTDVKTDAADRLKIGVVAVLCRSGDADAMAYLREVFESQPERRSSVAMGLAQSPGGPNWPLLLRSLPVLDANAAREVLPKLAEVDQTPTEPEPFRQVILRGWQLKANGGDRAIALLQKWTGKQLSEPSEPIEAALTKWQAWFAQAYPNQPPASLPVASEANKWNDQDLLEYLTGPEGSKGSAARGMYIFEKAQCAKCHRFGDRGEAVGPDLTNVSRRFQRKEILQSILFPSHVVSDQFASKSVRTVDGRTITGLAAQAPDGGLIVLTPLGEKVALAQDEIDAVAPSHVSAMPEGLLNDLTLEQIADLFAYLSRPPVTELTRQGNATQSLPK
jgi:putative heme-binding domain-containing protein